MLLSGGGGSAPTRYDRIRLGTGAQHPTVVQRHYALPPDGAGILFRDDVDGVPGSWWKAVDAVEASYIDGLDDISGPAFSPDGGWVAFARDGQLMKQELAGPAPIVLTDSVSEDYSPGIAWLPNGDILFEDRDHNLRVSRAAGGPAEIVATMEQVGQVFHVSAMPDGRGALVTGCETSCDATVTPQLSLVEFDDGRVARLRSGVWMAWPMDDGRIVMVDPAGTVSAAELDRTAATLGHPVPLLDGVRMSPVPDLAMGRDGSLLYIAGGAEPYGERLMWVDRNGVSAVADPDWPPGGNTRSMSLSPDDDRLAVGINPVGPPPERIWIKDFSSGLLTPLTEPSIEARRPVWGPDGKRIAFILQTEIGDGRLSGTVHGLPVDASTTEPTNLLDHDRMILEVAMTGDWETAVVRLGNAGDGAGDIAFTSLMPDAAWQALVRSEANEYGIALSPDGRWLAYVSELGGRPEVYVRPFPGPGPRVQVSRQGGVEPRWAHSGHEIFFRSPEPDAPPGGDTRAMMSASVSVDPAFVVESVDELFSTTGYAVGNRAPLYDVTSDDERFLMVTRFTPRGWTTGEVVYSNGWYWSDQIQARLGR
jgi:serine/threonine-protein kinase